MNPTPSARFIICMSLGLSAFLNLAVPIAAHAQANSWTTTTNGNWEDAANWSLGVPPSMFQSAIFVTNGIAGFKTITINGTNSSTMTISNLTVAGTNFLNTAQLSNGTLVVRNALTITSGGVFRQLGGELIVDGRISINSGTLQFSSPLTISTGTLWITGGQVVVTTNSVDFQFKKIPGWHLPANQTASVLPGQITHVSGIYTPDAPPLADASSIVPGDGAGLLRSEYSQNRA